MYAFKPYVFINHEPIGTERPQARSGHKILSNDKNLYSYGGFNPHASVDHLKYFDPKELLSISDADNPERSTFKEIWKYNFVSRTWKKFQMTIPEETASSVIILKEDTIIVFGGTGYPYGERCNNHVYIFNIKEDREFLQLPVNGHIPRPQYGQAACFSNPSLYVVGGTDGFKYSCDVYKLNIDTQTWIPFYISNENDPVDEDKSEPKARYKHEVGFDGRNIYMLGGGNQSEVFGFQDIHFFDTLKRKWMLVKTIGDKGKNFPAPRKYYGFVQTKRVVIISGGCDMFQIFNDVWKLDLRTLEWTCLKTCLLPRPIFFHSASLTPKGQMFIFGGNLGESEDVSALQQRSDKIYSVWLGIPKLSEICWEALTFYFPNLSKKLKEELLKLNIPLKFVQRVEYDKNGNI